MSQLQTDYNRAKSKAIIEMCAEILDIDEYTRYNILGSRSRNYDSHCDFVDDLLKQSREDLQSDNPKINIQLVLALTKAIAWYKIDNNYDSE